MQKLAGNSWFVRMLKISMPIKFRHTLGYGWDVEFPKCAGDTFSMITHKCIYQQIFSKYGMPEMTAVFCRVDDVLYSNLPRAEFLYTQQIGNGGSMCDYTFKEALNKSRHASYLHIFRLIARKLLEIHQVFLRHFRAI